MIFSIYKNLYSSKASGEITAGALASAIRGGAYREMVEQIRRLRAEDRKDEVSRLKREMPAVTFSGVCAEGRSFEKTTRRTGWAMFDFDSIPTELIPGVREKLQSCPWVVMVFVTVSGAGLRAVVNIGMVSKGDYTRAYTAVARHLQELSGAEPDMQCKDFARLSVVSDDPDVYFNPSADVADSLLWRRTSPPKADMNSAGRPCPDTDEVISTFFARYPYVKGSRHGTLLRLGKYLRWRGVESWQMGYVTDRICSLSPDGDMPRSEVEKALSWGFDRGNPGVRGPGGSGSLYRGSRGALKGRHSGTQDDTDEDTVINSLCSFVPDHVYLHLPPSLADLLAIARDRTERDILLLSSLAVMSGTFPYLRTMYGNRLYSPHLYSFIVSPAGSGKGVSAFAMRLTEKIDQRLEQRYAIMRQVYEKKLLEWELEKRNAMHEKRVPDISLCPEPPRRVMLSIPSNSSKSQFMLGMHAAEEMGQILATSEMDSLNAALSTDYGKHMPELRMAFHHEPIGQNYKVDGEPIIIHHPKLAMLVVGTMMQQMRFISNTEDGMLSRIAPWVSARRGGWKSQSPLRVKGSMEADSIVSSLAERLANFFFDREGEVIMIDFTEEQWQRHDARFEEMLDMVSAESSEDSEAIVIRGGLIAVRMAMVLCGLRIMEGGWNTRNYLCSDEDFDAALDIETNCIRHAIHLTTIYKSENDRRHMRAFYQKLEVVKQMPDTFSFSDFTAKGMEMGFSLSALKRALKSYLKAGVVEKNSENLYSKKRMPDDRIYGSEVKDD